MKVEGFGAQSSCGEDDRGNCWEGNLESLSDIPYALTAVHWPKEFLNVCQSFHIEVLLWRGRIAEFPIEEEPGCGMMRWVAGNFDWKTGPVRVEFRDSGNNDLSASSGEHYP
jgi:hypothetical protein